MSDQPNFDSESPAETEVFAAPYTVFEDTEQPIDSSGFLDDYYESVVEDYYDYESVMEAYYDYESVMEAY